MRLVTFTVASDTDTLAEVLNISERFQVLAFDSADASVGETATRLNVRDELIDSKSGGVIALRAKVPQRGGKGAGDLLPGDGFRRTSGRVLIQRTQQGAWTSHLR
jgi:hypothetical protein